MESAFLMGVKLNSVTEATGLESCRQFLRNNNQQSLATVNAEFIVKAQTDQTFKKILNQTSLNLVDSFGVVLMAKLFKGVKLSRLTGADFFWPLLSLTEQENKSVYFLGGMVGAAARTAELAKQKLPNLRLAGFNQGPFFQIKNNQIIFNLEQEKINAAVLAEIQQNQPDILLVAFGAPKQEYWLNEFLKECPSVKIAIGLGGTFDFISGQIKRAPKFLRTIGLEWFWRLLIEPRRIKRIFNALIKFPFSCFNYYILKKALD